MSKAQNLQDNFFKCPAERTYPCVYIFGQWDQITGSC